MDGLEGVVEVILATAVLIRALATFIKVLKRSRPQSDLEA